MVTGKPRATLAGRLGMLGPMLAQPRGRRAVAAGLALAAGVAALAATWQRWGRPALDGPEYRLTVDRIEATPPPDWINTPVVEEAFRHGNLASLSLHDPMLVQRVAEAFALHPWVARVVRVEKRYPTRVRVELEYRRPVAVVPVATRRESGLLLVDAQGVLLPTQDFVSAQARDYLRIEGIDTLPAGVYGTPWGDRRVSEAASIVAAIGPRWKELGLYAIVPVSAEDGELYELRTPQGVRLTWGRPPDSHDPSEPPPQEKIAALAAYIRREGPLEREGGPAQLDLRELARAERKATVQGPGASKPPRAD